MRKSSILKVGHEKIERLEPAEHVVEKILEIFSVRKTEKHGSRFCGPEWVQGPETFNNTVTCQDTTENIDLAGLWTV